MNALKRRTEAPPILPIVPYVAKMKQWAADSKRKSRSTDASEPQFEQRVAAQIKKEAPFRRSLLKMVRGARIELATPTVSM